MMSMILNDVRKKTMKKYLLTMQGVQILKMMNNINHYYIMDKNFKEEAKSVLGMQQVPFYVVLNEFGEIVQKGSKKQVNFEDIPGIVRQEEEKVEETKEEQALERVFCLDEDF